MFKTDYKKKIEKLISKKTTEMVLLKQITDKYTKEEKHSEEKIKFVNKMIEEIGEEILRCKTETEYTKEKYEAHKDKFNEIIKRKEIEYYGKKKEEK